MASISDFSTYSGMSLKELEELAFAIHIPYSPPLTDDQKDDVLKEVKGILENSGLTRKQKKTLISSKRNKKSYNSVTLVGRHNVLLKSDAQLTFLLEINALGEEIYYSLDTVTDIPVFLDKKKNPFNSKSLSPEQVNFLENALKNNPYPRIETGEYFEEIEKRLLGKVESEIPLFKKHSEQLGILIKERGLEYSETSVIQFANNLNKVQYEDYLRHKSFQQTLRSNERNEAATETLSLLMNYYNLKKNVSIEQGNLALLEIGKTIEEYMTMITRGWDYNTLREEIGEYDPETGRKELYWKPKSHYEDEDDPNLRAEGVLDDNGLRTGRWVISYIRQNNLQAMGEYLNGQRTGEWTSWYKNGNKYRQGNYQNGQPTGEWTSWHQNGNKRKEGNYENGQKTGPWTYWHQNGNKRKEGNYQNGQRTGLWTEWHRNRNKASEGNYQNGQRTGLWTFWYENGNKEEGNYENGQLTGLWTFWYSNGNKEEEGNYQNGQQTGLWTTWHSNGNKEEEGNYQNGQRTEIWTFWHPNGNRSKEGHYQNGRRTGLWTTWHENEIEASQGNYENGQLTGEWATWHPNGNKESQGSYQNGQRTGLWTSWYGNGNKESEGNYQNGQPTGLWTSWLENGEENRNEL